MNPMTAGVILSTVALLVQGTRCLMRQGAPPFGLAVAAGLGLHVQRLKGERPGRLGALLILGVCVGLFATMRITTLNPEADAFQVYAYDLWWPPLLVWVSVCFLDGAITILGVKDRRVRVGAFAALLLGLAWAARSRSWP